MLRAIAGFLTLLLAGAIPAWADMLVAYEVVDGTSIPKSLTGRPGDPERGRTVAADKKLGNCLACHQIPTLADQPFHGDLGPSLAGIATRRGEDELRLRIVDSKRLNADTAMPAFYRADGFFRVMPEFADKTVLTAEQVEDVVAFLSTLTDPLAPVPATELRYEPWALVRLPSPPGNRLPELISGRDFQAPETRAVEADDAANPGFLWVQLGERLWSQADGAVGKSCASCHAAAEASMSGLAAKYPKHDERAGKVVNLSQRINLCRAELMQAEPWKFPTDELTAMTLFVRHQSNGLPMAVQIDGPAADAFKLGQEHFYQRRGQLDLSCAHCHDTGYGQRLRGDQLTQGQTNSYPAYWLTDQAMGELQSVLPHCNERVRSTPFPYLDDEYIALELFLAWRGQGLPVETPAVRW